MHRNGAAQSFLVSQFYARSSTKMFLPTDACKMEPATCHHVLSSIVFLYSHRGLGTEKLTSLWFVVELAFDHRYKKGLSTFCTLPDGIGDGDKHDTHCYLCHVAKLSGSEKKQPKQPLWSQPVMPVLQFKAVIKKGFQIYNKVKFS